MAWATTRARVVVVTAATAGVARGRRGLRDDHGRGRGGGRACQSRHRRGGAEDEQPRHVGGRRTGQRHRPGGGGRGHDQRAGARVVVTIATAEPGRRSWSRVRRRRVVVVVATAASAGSDDEVVVTRAMTAGSVVVVATTASAGSDEEVVVARAMSSGAWWWSRPPRGRADSTWGRGGDRRGAPSGRDCGPAHCRRAAPAIMRSADGDSHRARSPIRGFPGQLAPESAGCGGCRSVSPSPGHAVDRP